MSRLRIERAQIVIGEVKVGQAEIELGFLLGRSFGLAGRGDRRVEIGGKVEIDFRICNFGSIQLGSDRRLGGGRSRLGRRILIRNLVLKLKAAQQFLFEIEAEIVLFGHVLRRGGRLSGPAWPAGAGRNP